MQCACAILSSVDCPAVHFFTLFYNWYDFQEKAIEVGAELFHADRRTGMTKSVVAFHNIANAPKR